MQLAVTTVFLSRALYFRLGTLTARQLAMTITTLSSVPAILFEPGKHEVR